jgi:hypothetical protein
MGMLVVFTIKVSNKGERLYYYHYYWFKKDAQLGSCLHRSVGRFDYFISYDVDEFIQVRSYFLKKNLNALHPRVLKLSLKKALVSWEGCRGCYLPCIIRDRRVKLKTLYRRPTTSGLFKN